MWQSYFVFPWHPIFIGARRIWLGEVMRRLMPDRTYEYRELSETESADRLAESSF